MGVLDLADRSWPLLRKVMDGHTLVYRASGGRVGHRFGGLIPQTLLLEHVGAKSGQKRTSPLTYTRDGDDLVLVASKGGYPKNPAWFYNLKAHPDTYVQVERERRPVHARVATDEEHARLWPKVVQTYSGYDVYQKRTNRKIPLVILERRVS